MVSSPRTESAPLRWRVLALLGWSCALLLALAACGGGGDLPDDVVAQFAVDNNAIADLTNEGDERIRTADLLDAVGRARSAGTDLRVVIAASDGELVPPQDVVARYGGTALSFKANSTTFEVYSDDISDAQLFEATRPASEQATISGSAGAFVAYLQRQGIQANGFDWTRLLYVALVLALLFMLWQLWRFLNARKRRAKRKAEFMSRRSTLTEWGGQLRGEVVSLHQAIPLDDTSARSTLDEVAVFAQSIEAKVADATNIGELDAAEMRIGRSFIKLRELRKSLTS